jgi:uncharacterized membrane protein YesL
VQAALRAWWQAARHLNHRGYLYIWANLLWVILTLLVIPAPAAWAGLTRLSYVAFRQPTASLDEFWAGFRANFRRGAVVAIVTVVVVVVNLSNLLTYTDAGDDGVWLLRLLWLAALGFWFLLQFFAWPLLDRMEQPSLLGAYRNAAVMIYLNPLFSLVTLALISLLVIVSSALPVAWVLLTGSALAVAATSCVANRLEAAGFRRDLPLSLDPVEDAGLPDL